MNESDDEDDPGDAYKLAELVHLTSFACHDRFTRSD
jgi:hypothetical protein